MHEITIALFVEDVAQEALLDALVQRRAQERGVTATLRVLTARGGSPRTLEEYKAFQRVLEKPTIAETPDVVVLARDTDCRSASETKKELTEQLDTASWGAFVAACPKPCVEAWYLLDRQALQQTVGAGPKRNPRPCDCPDHKNLLADAVRAGGGIPTLGGAEVASDLVGSMRLYRCCKAASDFKHFIDDLDEALARVAAERS
jgi:hypothetical protein